MSEDKNTIYGILCFILAAIIITGIVGYNISNIEKPVKALSLPSTTEIVLDTGAKGFAIDCRKSSYLDCRVMFGKVCPYGFNIIADSRSSFQDSENLIYILDCRDAPVFKK